MTQSTLENESDGNMLSACVPSNPFHNYAAYAHAAEETAYFDESYTSELTGTHQNKAGRNLA